VSRPRKRRKAYYDPGVNPRERDPLKMKRKATRNPGLSRRLGGMKGQAAILAANEKRARRAEKRRRAAEQMSAAWIATHLGEVE
jgi:hypothetical protein